MAELRQQPLPRLPQRSFHVLRTVVTRLLLFTGIWWILTDGDEQAWAVGSAVVLAALLVSLRLMPAGPRRVSLRGFLAFSVFFVVRSVIAGTQVALIAMRPRLDLHPVIIEMPTRLQDEAERTFLVSTVSLFPGTLSAGLEGNKLRLHVLDERMPVEEELRSIEFRVARLFGGELA